MYLEDYKNKYNASIKASKIQKSTPNIEYQSNGIMLEDVPYVKSSLSERGIEVFDEPEDNDKSEDVTFMPNTPQQTSEIFQNVEYVSRGVILEDLINETSNKVSEETASKDYPEDISSQYEYVSRGVILEDLVDEISEEVPEDTYLEGITDESDEEDFFENTSDSTSEDFSEPNTDSIFEDGFFDDDFTEPSSNKVISEDSNTSVTESNPLVDAKKEPLESLLDRHNSRRDRYDRHRDYDHHKEYPDRYDRHREYPDWYDNHDDYPGRYDRSERFKPRRGNIRSQDTQQNQGVGFDAQSKVPEKLDVTSKEVVSSKPDKPVEKKDYKNVREYVKCNPGCSISDVKQYFSIKDIQKALMGAKIVEKKNKLYVI